MPRFGLAGAAQPDTQVFILEELLRFDMSAVTLHDDANKNREAGTFEIASKNAIICHPPAPGSEPSPSTP